MGFYATSPVMEEEPPHPSSPAGLRRDLRKNRVVGSERFSFDRARLPALQAPESHQETTLIVTIIVSGRWSFWTVDAFQGFSRDPMSLHKYGFARSNPVLFIDPLGNLSTLEEAAIAWDIVARFAMPSPYRTLRSFSGTGKVPPDCRGGTEFDQWQLQKESVGVAPAVKAYDLSRDAMTLAVLVEGLPTGSASLSGGSRDAFRHCYWSCRMVQEIGLNNAALVGDIHELCGDKNPMDYFNNYVGRSIAAGSPGCSCESDCLDAARSGRLDLSMRYGAW